MKRTVIPFPVIRTTEDEAAGEAFDRMPAWLRQRRGLSWTSKALWAFLSSAPARHYHGLVALAFELAVSKNTIRRCVAELESAGLLFVHDRGTGRAPRRTPIHPPEVFDGE